MSASEPRGAPSGLASALVLARVTWLRLVRGRALWVSLGVAALPCLFAAMMRASGSAIGDELYAFEILALSILGPMFVAGSLGDEIEDRTTTYLWSRPIPRWAVLAGKLALLAPLLALVVCASWLVAGQLAWHVVPPAQTFGALGAGALAVALVASGIAMIAPRHGMALAICYLLFFDGPVGLIPATVQEASVMHQVRTLSGLWPAEGTVADGAIALIAIAAVWGALAAWRVRRLES